MGKIGSSKQRAEDIGMLSEVSAHFERRPFQKEMEDLGVEVIKSESCKFTPFKVPFGQQKGRHIGPLGNGMVALNVGGMSFPRNMEDVVRGKYIKFGILEYENLKEGVSKKVLAWRVLERRSRHSYLVKESNRGILTAGTKQVMEQIVAAGFPYGVYRPEEVKGGWIAHLVRARKIERKGKKEEDE